MAVQEGFNQSPPYLDVDLYASDEPLKEAVAAKPANEAGDETPAAEPVSAAQPEQETEAAPEAAEEIQTPVTPA